MNGAAKAAPMSWLLLSVAILLPTTGKAQFAFVTNNGAITITGYSGSAASLAIPDATNGYPITGIGAQAFMRHSSLTNVVLPDSIVTIGDSAFTSCFGLATINLPSNLASIGASAFDGCKLTAVTVPQTVTYIGSRAFAGCTLLESITVDGLNPGFSDLDGVLFNKARTTLIQCPAQKAGTYLVPNSVTAIGDAAFNRSALGSIVLPTGVVSIGAGTFAYAAATNISLPSTVTSIGIQAFMSCSNLLSVAIPNGVSTIGWYTFFRCTSLTNLTIGNHVTSIGESAFYGCSSLTHVEIPDSVMTLDTQAFINCSGLRTVRAGKGLSDIGTSAFLGCVNLTGIYFTGNAPAVGSWIFGYSNVIVYYLPEAADWGPSLGGWPTALWLPAIQTGGPNFGVNSNQFGFNISWAAGQSIIVEAAQDLAVPSWQSLLTNNLTSDTFYFSDSDWNNHPTRIYRVRSP
jgi:hypothetical protein